MLVVNKKDHIGSYDCKGSKSSNEKSDLRFVQNEVVFRILGRVLGFLKKFFKPKFVLQTFLERNDAAANTAKDMGTRRSNPTSYIRIYTRHSSCNFFTIQPNTTCGLQRQNYTWRSVMKTDQV